MALSEMITTISSCGGAAVVILLLGIIKVKPLEISIWSWLFRKIGKAFNGETLDKIDKLENQIDDLEDKLDNHEERDKEKDILNIRQHILRFADEMFEGVYHSREYFEEILMQISKYEKYCLEHPDFQNNQAVTSIKIIKDQYEECMRKHSFYITKKNNEDKCE